MVDQDELRQLIEDAYRENRADGAIAAKAAAVRAVRERYGVNPSKAKFLVENTPPKQK